MKGRHVLQILLDRGSRRRAEQTASVRNGFPVTEGPLFVESLVLGIFFNRRTLVFEIVSIFVVVAFPVIVVVFLFSFSFASSQRYQPGLFALTFPGNPRS